MKISRIRTSAASAALGAAITASTMVISSTAYAAGVITAIDFDSNSLGGSVNSISLDNLTNTIDVDKVFSAIAPITLHFTVGHAQGGSGSYDVTEFINNSTALGWTDYHLSIVQPEQGNAITFGSFQSATLNGFDLDAPPSSGPRNLNFTGALAAGDTMHASFEMHLFDPGANNTYSFDLVQSPSVGGGGPGGNPVPVPVSAWLFASGLIGLGRLAKRRQSAKSAS